MDVKLFAVVAALAMVIYAPSSQAAKPISLVERCYCRSTISNIPRGLIQELRLIQTPNCPFQVIAKLKANKEVCVNPESRWVKQFVRSVINKRKTQKAQLKGQQRST